MLKNKVFQLFQLFDVWEIKQLQQFLASPFFNRRRDVIDLLNFLVKTKNKTKPDFSRKTAFQAVYPNESYDEQQMYLLMSYLSKLIEQFLAYREISKDKTLQSLHLAKAYRQAKIDEGFKRTIAKEKKVIHKKALRDGHYLRQVYDLELEYYDHIGSRSRATENNLQDLSDAFDLMYIAEKLKQFCFQVAHQSVFKKEYSSALHQAILAVLEKENNYLNHPSVGIYFHCYKAITTGEESYFQELRNLMQLHSNKFTTTEIGGIHILAINYCIKRMNTGEPKYIREAFELYRAGFEGGFLLENGEISRFSFNNTVIAAIKLKEFDWVEQFIESYRHLLPKPFRKSVYEYALSWLRYEQKKYPEAMRLLATFDSSDHLMNLGAKLTLLKIYYELEEFDALESLLESMRLYLQRKEIIGYHRDYYGKIIRLTKKLLRMTGNKKEKMVFRGQVEELQVASMRDWFLEQVG